MPKQHIQAPLSLRYTAEQMAAIRLGFVPWDQNQKWFIYFNRNTLSLHRSWTGFCIYRVRFERSGSTWQAVEAQINRCPDQYGCEDVLEDQALLAQLIDSWLLDPQASNPENSGFMQGLHLAMQSSYLGSPTIVQPRLARHFQLLLEHLEGHPDGVLRVARREAYSADARRLELVFSGADPEFTAMPGWHSAEALGASLVKHFDLDAGYCAGESLFMIVSEALASLSNHMRSVLKHALADPDGADRFPQQLTSLFAFVVSVFLGTESVVAPDKTLKDFAWQATAA